MVVGNTEAAGIEVAGRTSVAENVSAAVVDMVQPAAEEAASICIASLEPEQCLEVESLPVTIAE